MAYYRSEIRKTSFVKAHYALARLLRDKGRLDEARRHYQQVLRRGKTRELQAMALNGLGLVRRAEGRTTEALACYRAAARRDPRQAEPLINAATAFLADGHLAQGRAWLQRTLRRGKREPDVDKRVGYCLVEYDVDVRRGVRLLERAVARRDSDAEAWADLAVGYLKMGSLSQARAAARAARTWLPRKEALRKQILNQLRRVAEAGRKRHGRRAAKAALA